MFFILQFNPLVRMLPGSDGATKVSVRMESEFTPTGTKTAGKSASYQAKNKRGILHQVKLPGMIRFSRRAMGYDKTVADILGEYIASQISQQTLNVSTNGVEVSPETLLLLRDKSSEGEPRIAMAAKYLNNDKKRRYIVFTMDDLYEKVFGVKLEQKHIVIDFSKPVGKTAQDVLENGVMHTDQEFTLYTLENTKSEHPQVKVDKKELCRSIKNSFVLGDHDVNPGNGMLIFDTKTKTTYVGRIDYGNAFNNLIKNWRGFSADYTPRLNSNNFMLDAFNRTEINGWDTTPKIRVSYRNYLLDPDFIAEMKRDNPKVIENLAKGLENVKEGIAANFDDPKAREQICEGLQMLMKQIKSDNVPEKPSEPAKGFSKKEAEDLLANTVSEMTTFVVRNLEESKSVGNLLDIQAKIERALKGNKDWTIGDIEELYNMDQHHLKGKKFADSVEWVRLEDQKGAFKGSLEEYVKHRAQQLGMAMDDKRVTGLLAAIDQVKQRDAKAVDQSALQKLAKGSGLPVATVSGRKRKQPTLTVDGMLFGR